MAIPVRVTLLPNFFHDTFFTVEKWLIRYTTSSFITNSFNLNSYLLCVFSARDGQLAKAGIVASVVVLVLIIMVFTAVAIVYFR